MIRFSSAFDVLLSPVLSGPAVALGVMDADDRSLSYLEMTAKFFTIMPFTPVFNLTGQPAMSMPLGQAASGMPIGVQFAGRFGDEATLFSLAGQIERAAPWRSRVPPCFAGS
jgi:amidase